LRAGFGPGSAEREGRSSGSLMGLCVTQVQKRVQIALAQVREYV
jgi:hypothetical protein